MTEFEKISRLIAEGHLRQAISSLRRMASAAPNHQLLSSLDEIEKAYKYLIQYFSQGVADSSRADMLSGIRNRLLEISDSLEFEQDVKDKNSYFFSTIRTERLRSQSLSSLLNAYEDARSTLMLAELDPEAYNEDLHKAEEEALSAIFRLVWTSRTFSKDDAKLVADILSSNPSYELRSQVVTALMLGLLERYQSQKMQLLIDAYSDEGTDDRLAARLMVAILIVASLHPKRLAEDRESLLRLDAWQDSLITYQRLNHLLMAYLKTRDTDRIMSKMREEVIPELQKMTPELMKRMKDVPEDLEAFDPETNPEWQEMLQSSGLADRLKELQEIQEQGGDVMMAAFSNLKSFPFFQNIANWFLPFSSDHSQLKAWREMRSDALLALVDSDGLPCDSDCYSFALAITQMPQSRKDMMAAQLGSAMDMMTEDNKTQLVKSSHPGFDREASRFLRDLFRFFRLFRHHADFRDPFAQPIDFAMLPALGALLNDDDTLRLVAEFYFSRKYYPQAAPLFEKLAADHPEDAQNYEKLGFSLQKSGNFAEAYRAYQNAELFNPDSPWLLKRLAYVSSSLGRPAEAAGYYKRIMVRNPDDLGSMLKYSIALMDSGKASEALPLLYKYSYLKPESVDALRIIAEAEAISGNLESAANYAGKVLQTEHPHPTDYLNAGHIALARKDAPGALELYRKSIAAFPDGLKDFYAKYDGDYDSMRRIGAEQADIRLVRDIIAYGKDLA